MTNEQLKERISSLAQDAIFEENKQFLIATISPKDLYSVAKSLKESKDTAFDFLFSLTGVDYDPSLTVVYHLESSTLKHKVVIKAKTEDRLNPSFPSVCDIWFAAELQEREVFDMFGVKFENHPDLRRIFMDEDWQGYPLRKDYKDEVNIIDLIK